MASIERSPKGVVVEIPTFPVVLSNVKLAEAPNPPLSLNWIWVSAPVGLAVPPVSLPQARFPRESVVIFPELVKVEQFTLLNLNPLKMLRPPAIVEVAEVEVALKLGKLRAV